MFKFSISTVGDYQRRGETVSATVRVLLGLVRQAESGHGLSRKVDDAPDV